MDAIIAKHATPTVSKKLVKNHIPSRATKIPLYFFYLRCFENISEINKYKVCYWQNE